MDNASISWANGAPITGVPDANGVSPLALENIIQLRLFLHDGHPWGWYYPVENVDSPVLDLMNVKYLLTRPDGAGPLWSNPRYRHAASLPGYELFENLPVMPRFFLVREIRTAASLAEARRLIGSGVIDFRRTAVTDAPIALPAANPVNGITRDEIKVSQYQPDSLRLSIRTPAAAFLVLSENDYPGWEAWLDDAPVAIYRTDIAFRGVVVPAGEHVLRMEFHPVILRVSSAISFATGVLLLFLWWRGRRPPDSAIIGKHRGHGLQRATEILRRHRQGDRGIRAAAQVRRFALHRPLPVPQRKDAFVFRARRASVLQMLRVRRIRRRAEVRHGI